MIGSRSARIVIIALAVLGLGWWFAPRLAPPVYDGVGFPDEPYRFVVRPSGAPVTKPPTVASQVVPVTQGVAGAASLASAEQAPQVAILIPTGRLQAPSGTTQIRLKATPVRPVAPPAGGYLWSDVYDIGATDPGVTMRDGNPPATITLRAATAQRPLPTIERFQNGTWTKLKTLPVGRDIYEAALPGFGKYAVVGTDPLQFGASRNATSRTGLIIFVAALVVVIALVIVGWRRRAGRQEIEETPDEETAT